MLSRTLTAPRAVFFDVGDTLLDTSAMLDAALYTALVPIAPGVSLAEVRRAVETSAADLPTRTPPFEDVRENVEWWMDRYRRVGEALTLSPEALDRFVHRVVAGHLTGDPLRVVPGVPEVLGALAARGLRLGVISNWDDTLDDILTRKGLREHFETVVVSTAFGQAKPSREIFEHALQTLGVAASEAWHVGDDANADAAGAARAGLTAVLLDPLGMYASMDRYGIVRVKSIDEAGERILAALNGAAPARAAGPARTTRP
jgi:putative hydrolase of the HAD superfamily